MSDTVDMDGGAAQGAPQGVEDDDGAQHDVHDDRGHGAGAVPVRHGTGTAEKLGATTGGLATVAAAAA